MVLPLLKKKKKNFFNQTEYAEYKLFFKVDVFLKNSQTVEMKKKINLNC